MTIKGYAGVFYDGTPGTEFRLGPHHVERMMPTAFDSIRKRAKAGGPSDIVGLFNHDMSLVLGRRSAKTLTLRIDDRGLFYEISPANTTVYRDVQEHQQRGDVIGSSLGFVATDERHIVDGSLNIREIHAMQIRDVGPVTYPAYAGTNEVRMVTPDGIAMPLPDEVAAEVRGLMSCEHGPVQVRMRQIQLDSNRLHHFDL